MNSEFFPYSIRYKLWVENSDLQPVLGDGKWELLKTIHECGSLKLAIEKMGWTYRTTWNKLKEIEKRLGFKLTEKTRGGTGGGGQTILTPEGKKLVEMFYELHQKVDIKMNEIFIEFIDSWKSN